MADAGQTSNPEPAVNMHRSVDAEVIRSALADADIRVLLMVLFQLTGDARWLEPPFQPARDLRLIADPDAGLPGPVVAEARDAALTILSSPPVRQVVERPDIDLLTRMLSVCLGEQIPAEYGPMMAHEMGFAEDVPPMLADRSGEHAAWSAIVIGAGVSGIAAAIKLREAGVSVRVLEKNRAVGGTWLENTYPDCGVDTPNHFYSYSFAPNPSWTRHFALRDEIYDYLERCTDRLGVRELISFGATVERAQWDERRQHWDVDFRDETGATHTASASILISAVGMLNRPHIPEIAGLETFEGPVFHSARWRHDVPLDGRRVGVVGTGASAVQFVPQIAPRCGELVVFQRSPQWIRPIDEYRSAVPGGVAWLATNVPGYAAWLRGTLAWRFGDGLHRHLKRDPDWPHPERSMNRINDRHRVELTEYIRAELEGDEMLLAKVLPDYPPYGKRMLADAGWYQTLRRDNVDLVTDPIRAITSRGIVTGADGNEHALDVLIFSTGFQAGDPLGHMDIRGRTGVTLADRWASDGPRAHLGMTVPGFPNFFMLYGPNTNLAFGGSIIFHAECQVHYIGELLRKMADGNIAAVDVKEDVYADYNQRLDDALSEMVWSHPRAASWYRHESGRVLANSPWRLVDYWHMTRQPSLDAFQVQARRAAASLH